MRLEAKLVVSMFKTFYSSGLETFSLSLLMKELRIGVVGMWWSEADGDGGKER
jgi:hypothetical protein